MPDLTISDGDQTDQSDLILHDVETTVGGDLAAISNEYGPRRVKTPNMEVEQFDPSTLQRLKERDNVRLPSFGSLNFSIGTPKPCGYSNRPIKSHEQSPTDCCPPE